MKLIIIVIALVVALVVAYGVSTFVNEKKAEPTAVIGSNANDNGGTGLSRKQLIFMSRSMICQLVL